MTASQDAGADRQFVLGQRHTDRPIDHEFEAVIVHAHAIRQWLKKGAVASQDNLQKPNFTNFNPNDIVLARNPQYHMFICQKMMNINHMPARNKSFSQAYQPEHVTEL